MQSIVVEHSIWIAAPRTRIWRAVTSPEQLEQWFAEGCSWEIPALHLGEKIRFRTPPAGALTATIEAVFPPRLFVLRWHPDAESHDRSFVMRFVLDEEDGGTRFTITESGRESLPSAALEKCINMTGSACARAVEALKASFDGVLASSE